MSRGNEEARSADLFPSCSMRLLAVPITRAESLCEVLRPTHLMHNRDDLDLCANDAVQH